MDPLTASPANNAISTALLWLQGVFLGSAATTVAVIAIAWMGFLMLTGQYNIRRGAQVIIGCFIIFGASTIASGILAAVSTTSAGPQAPSSAALSILPGPLAVAPSAETTPFDPYAGAALPQR